MLVKFTTLLTRKAFKFPIINNIQKTLLIVLTMSIVIFAISAYHFNTLVTSPEKIQYFGGFIRHPTKYEFFYKTNWLGMIAFGSAIASIVGFFLFKDKK